MNGAAATHAVLVLAAGASRRLGRPKQTVEIDGEPMVLRTVRAALATAPVCVGVVLGAHADGTFAALAGLPVQRIDCSDWQHGMGASLRCGLQQLGAPCAGVLVLVCDQPRLTAAHLQALVSAWRADPARAVASRYGGTLGVPAVLPQAWFAELMALDADRGARELLRAPGAGVIGIAAPDLAFDIDANADLLHAGTQP